MATAAVLMGIAACSSPTKPTTSTTTTTTPATTTTTTTPTTPTTPACATVPSDQLLKQVGADNGSITVEVSAGEGCPWTASTGADFLQVATGGTGIKGVAGAAGISGTGPGTVRIVFAANTTGERTGIVTVGVATVTVAQAAAPTPGCTFSLSTRTVSLQNGYDHAYITVTASADACKWTAATSDSFINVGIGGANPDNLVTVGVVPNQGTARTGTVVIAGQTVTVTQAASDSPPCAFVVSPTSISGVPFTGQTVTVTATLTQGTGCAWSAATMSGFATLTSAASGVGSGSATFSIAPNPGVARIGSVILANRVVSVSQDGDPAAPSPCVTSISPTSQSFPVSGGDGSVTVVAPGTCTWSLIGPAYFLTVPSDTHTGNGTATYHVAANPGFGSRSASIAIGGRTLSVSEDPIRPVAVLSFRSDPGEFIGQGLTRNYTTTAPTTTTAQFGGTVRVTVPIPDGNPYSLDINAPIGQTLAPGFYDGALRWNTSVQPQLSFSGNARGCNTSVGRFVIGEIAFDGSTVTRLHAKFEQHCENASAVLAGELWFDQFGDSAVPPMAALPPVPASPVSFLTVNSDAGDRVGDGLSFAYGIQSANFTPTPDGTAFAIHVKGNDGRSWDFTFEDPTGRPPGPGHYANAIRPKVPMGGSPGLLISGGNGVGCSTVTGSFDVLEFETDPTGNVLRFRATFEQHCNGIVPALRGEIYIVANPWR